MSIALAGALIGLFIAAFDFAVLNALSRRVELDDTRRVLKVVGLVQFAIWPVLGWFVAPFVMGE